MSVIGPKTGEKWASAELAGFSVTPSPDGVLVFITDEDGDTCSLPRKAWVPVADALLAIYVASRH